MTVDSEVSKEIRELFARGAKLTQLLAKNTDDDKIKFHAEYQNWYSTAGPLVRFLAPDRADEFEHLYLPPRRSARDIALGAFGIGDWLAGMGLTTHDTDIVVFALLETQVRILGSLIPRLHSKIGDLRGLLQADLFDHELDAARHLADNGHLRAAGAIAGVVLEGHLDAVCHAHGVKFGRKKRTISNLNDGLKDAGVVGVPVWRHIQGLADIRNLCDHKRGREPTPEEIQRLLDGTDQHAKELH